MVRLQVIDLMDLLVYFHSQTDRALFFYFELRFQEIHVARRLVEKQVIVAFAFVYDEFTFASGW
jgi:protein involved in ribonucleotide reduction